MTTNPLGLPGKYQAISINSNQIWKSGTAGDATLYLQYNTPNGNVMIGGSGGSTALLVNGYAAMGTNTGTACNSTYSSIMFAGLPYLGRL